MTVIQKRISLKQMSKAFETLMTYRYSLKKMERVQCKFTGTYESMDAASSRG